jgi:hypothetical protein
MCIYTCAALRHKCEDTESWLQTNLILGLNGDDWSASSSGRFDPAKGGLVATDVAVNMFLGAIITICRHVQIFLSMSVCLTACTNREIC